MCADRNSVIDQSKSGLDNLTGYCCSALACFNNVRERVCFDIDLHWTLSWYQRSGLDLARNMLIRWIQTLLFCPGHLL